MDGQQIEKIANVMVFASEISWKNMQPTLMC